MTTITKIAAVLGIIAGLGVSAMPLTSYAAPQDVEVKVTINSTIGGTGVNCTEASTSGAAGVQLSEVCTYSASSNNGLTIAIKDKDAVLNLVSGVNTIAPIASAETATGNLTKNGWGYKFGNITGVAGVAGTNSNAEKFTPITASNVTVFTTSTAGAVAGDFTFAAKTPESQATGTYTDVVTITTTAN